MQVCEVGGVSCLLSRRWMPGWSRHALRHLDAISHAVMTAEIYNQAASPKPSAWVGCPPPLPEITDESLHENVCNSLRGLMMLEENHLIPRGVSSKALLKSLMEMPVIHGKSSAKKLSVRECLQIALAAKPPLASEWLSWLQENHTILVSADSYEHVGAVLGSTWVYTPKSRSETTRRQALARTRGLLLFGVILPDSRSNEIWRERLGYYAIDPTKPARTPVAGARQTLHRFLFSPSTVKFRPGV